jgi:uncharacterized protein (DUF488 family)
VDIRTIPRSRHNPQFSGPALARKLRAARIGYVHLPKLGGLRRAKRDSINGGWRNASFRGYADHMQTPEFAEGLQRLVNLAKDKRSAVMCAEAVPWRCHGAEAVPWRCHRSMIADALTIRGMRVQHILGGKRSSTHSLASFAQVRGHAITYPADEASVATRQATTSIKLSG